MSLLRTWLGAWGDAVKATAAMAGPATPERAEQIAAAARRVQDRYATLSPRLFPPREYRDHWEQVNGRPPRYLSFGQSTLDEATIAWRRGDGKAWRSARR